MEMDIFNFFLLWPSSVRFARKLFSEHFFTMKWHFKNVMQSCMCKSQIFGREQQIRCVKVRFLPLRYKIYAYEQKKIMTHTHIIIFFYFLGEMDYFKPIFKLFLFYYKKKQKNKWNGRWLPPLGWKKTFFFFEPFPKTFKLLL